MATKRARAMQPPAPRRTTTEPTTADVFGLLEAGCERCHSPDGQASSTSFVLTDNVAGAYDETLPFIDLGAPASSRLLAKGAGNGHIGGVIYDERSTEYATILAWIEQGAMP
jgi:hypothetical protein